MLAGVLTGAAVSDGVASLYGNFSESGHSGHFLMALDISRWMPLDAYYDRFEQLVEAVKASHPERRVLLPGEVRWQNFRDNRRAGIHVETGVRRSLLALSEPYGIASPWEGADAGLPEMAV